MDNLDKIKYSELYVEIKDGFQRSTVRGTLKENQNIEDIEYPCTLLIDQSTKSGFSIWDSKKQLIKIVSVNIKDNCSVTEYKYILKDILKEHIDEYQVDTLIGEDIYNGENFHTSSVLINIKSILTDLEYEYSKEGNSFTFYAFNNKVWKSNLAKPKAFKFGDTENDKKEVRRIVSEYYPLLFTETTYTELTEDMTDSIGMGIGLILNRNLKGTILNMVQYNKRLPIHESIITKKEDETWEEVVRTLRKPFRDAYEVGSTFEMELNTRRKIDDQLRKILTHIDCLLVVKIERTYKDWGILVLKNNLSLEELNEDKSFYLISCRKKRK